MAFPSGFIESARRGRGDARCRSGRLASSVMYRSGKYFAPHADDLDSLVRRQFPPGRGAGQICLRLHEARSRACELGRHAHQRRRIAIGAVRKVRRFGLEQMSISAVSTLGSLFEAESHSY